MKEGAMKKFIFLIFIAGFFSSPEITGAQGNPANPPGAPKETQISFVVKWDGRVIPGITKISGLRRKTEIVEYRSGGDPSLNRRAPGKTEYQPIVLKRPRGDDKEFERWANKVWSLGAGLGSEVSLKDYRKDILIELHDDAGKVLIAFRVYRCWPSEYVALNDLDADDKSVAMEILALEHEGWERDYEIR
jgi:phage tail-like protein